MTIDIFGDENLCVNVYNPNEPDHSKKLICSYQNPWKASNALGITASNLRHHCVRKTRFYSPILDMEVAVRYVSNNKVFQR